MNLIVRKLEKILEVLPKFAKAYKISFGILRYRLDNPFYNRMLVSDKAFEAFRSMEADGYARIFESSFKQQNARL
ncbi:hypothetical protein [Helicobacter suis]|nr:hypothetical protein [Helicobacter suis]